MEYSREYIQKILSDVRKGKTPIPENMDRATSALFWENRCTSKTEQRGMKPIYNLSTRDHNGTLSMYHIYMQCLTEYEAALVLLGSLSHWNRLCERNWFRPHIEAWRAEMAIRDEAIGRAAMISGAANGNYAAGKALVSHTKVQAQRGRPKKVENKNPVGRVPSSTTAEILERAALITGEIKGGNRIN